MTSLVSAIVVAGGKSRRLGIDKRQIKLTSGQSLLAECVTHLTRLSDDVIVVIGRGEAAPSIAPARIGWDTVADAGPLAGLAAGLAMAVHEYAVVVAADMPFLDSRLLNWLIAQPRGYDLLIPRHRDGRCEPLLAIYRRTCLPAIESRLRSGHLKLLDLEHHVHTCYADGVDAIAGPDAFFNLNTQEDLEQIRDHLHDTGSLLKPVPPETGTTCATSFDGSGGY